MENAKGTQKLMLDYPAETEPPHRECMPGRRSPVPGGQLLLQPASTCRGASRCRGEVRAEVAVGGWFFSRIVAGTAKRGLCRCVA